MCCYTQKNSYINLKKLNSVKKIYYESIKQKMKRLKLLFVTDIQQAF